MNKRKFVAGVSIMTAAMAMGSPAMEAFAAETAVQFSGMSGMDIRKSLR